MSDEVSESFASGFMPALQNIAKEVLGQSGSIEELAKKIGTNLGDALEKISTWVKDHKEEIKDVLKVFMEAAPDAAGALALAKVAESIGKITEATKALGIAAAANPVILGIIGGVAISKGIEALKERLENPTANKEEGLGPGQSTATAAISVSQWRAARGLGRPAWVGFLTRGLNSHPQWPQKLPLLEI